jgi:hypothetical protein
MPKGKPESILERAKKAAIDEGTPLEPDEIEALRVLCEGAFEEGYAAAERDNFKRLSPNPYTKVN